MKTAATARGDPRPPWQTAARRRHEPTRLTDSTDLSTLTDLLGRQESGGALSCCGPGAVSCTIRSFLGS